MPFILDDIGGVALETVKELAAEIGKEMAEVSSEIGDYFSDGEFFEEFTDPENDFSPEDFGDESDISNLGSERDSLILNEEEALSNDEFNPEDLDETEINEEAPIEQAENSNDSKVSLKDIKTTLDVINFATGGSEVSGDEEVVDGEE